MGLIPINLHLQKLSSKSQLHAHSLLPNHILCSFIEAKPNITSPHHPLLLDSLIKQQCKLIKGHIVDMDNQFNEVFPLFDSLNSEFSPGNRIIDIFASCFSFHTFSKCNDKDLNKHIQQLDDLAIEASGIPFIALIVSDVSIKNNITTSILHIHIHNKPIIKILHHAVNVTNTEAELFAIRCGINQATCYNEISKITVVTDSIHTARKIFDSSLHPFQKQLTAILKELQMFFSLHQENSIKFWECPGCCNWSFHKTVNAKSKLFHPTPLFPSKLSWDFSKKQECNDLVNRWKMTFQVLDSKGKHFLDLVDGDENTLEPSYIKGSSWLKYFGHSNTLCARASRAITNHAPIGEY